VLHELQDRLTSSDRSNIEAKINQLREVVQGNDINQIKNLTIDLQNAYHALSQQLDAAQSPAQPGDGSSSGFTSSGNGHKPGNPDNEGEVLEGEFREM
jgi:molecular chaperone DnaK